MINSEEILKNIDLDMANKKKFNIDVYKTITSTNTVLKERASVGEDEWTVLIAEEQTKGKGRMNRKFYSPSDTGIYMSLVLRPCMEVSEALFVTTMTAAAVSQAIDEVFGVKTGIKWVNDIFIDDKKICGILAESVLLAGSRQLDYLVVGIGINVETPKEDFPYEIADIAGSIIGKKEREKYINNENTEELSNNKAYEMDIRNILIAKILTKMYKYYNQEDKHKYMDIYRKKSILIGKEIYILNDDTKEKLFVIDIDDEAALVVKHLNGDIERISSGEVSVRLF